MTYIFSYLVCTCVHDWFMTTVFIKVRWMKKEIKNCNNNNRSLETGKNPPPHRWIVAVVFKGKIIQKFASMKRNTQITNTLCLKIPLTDFLYSTGLIGRWWITYASLIAVWYFPTQFCFTPLFLSTVKALLYKQHRERYGFVENLQSHFILTMSHWSSGLPVCFPSQGTQVQMPWRVLIWNRDSPVSVVSLQVCHSSLFESEWKPSLEYITS